MMHQSTSINLIDIVNRSVKLGYKILYIKIFVHNSSTNDCSTWN